MSLLHQLNPLKNKRTSIWTFCRKTLSLIHGLPTALESTWLVPNVFHGRTNTKSRMSIRTLLFWTGLLALRFSGLLLVWLVVVLSDTKLVFLLFLTNALFTIFLTSTQWINLKRLSVSGLLLPQLLVVIFLPANSPMYVSSTTLTTTDLTWNRTPRWSNKPTNKKLFCTTSRKLTTLTIKTK